MEGLKKLTKLEKIFLALADKTRLRLLSLMREQEICVCFFTEILNESQPKISRHLAYLRNAGLVETRREGKWMHYRILEPEDKIVEKILYDSLNALAEHQLIKKDYENLAKVCCSPNMPVTIARAPTPQILQKADEIKRDQIENKPSTELEIFLL